MRLALTYALLDGAPRIGFAHLRAALAVWAFAAASARRVFADTACRSDADKLADFLADTVGGRTRTEIRDLFRRNRSTREIDELLRELGGYVTAEEDRSEAGRPVTRVYWTGPRRDSLGSLLAGEPDSPTTERLNDIPRSEQAGVRSYIESTTKPPPEKPQVSGDKSSGRNVVLTLGAAAPRSLTGKSEQVTGP